MKKSITILVLSFFCLGKLILPMGDFAILIDLPEMYAQCKTNEDVDMTVIDFFTDHIINIDGIFDKHNNGDKQKPHQPIKHHNITQKTIIFKNYNAIKVSPYFVLKSEPAIPIMNYAGTDYTKNIFRPPISIT